MTEKEQIKISKFLSLILRHRPEKIGISLDENGWVDIDELIQKANANHRKLDFDVLKIIVQNNSKKRFTFNKDKTKIRANQGHSISVDLEFESKEPPATLFHGTGEKYVPSIKKEGLVKKNRNHVHLSTNIETALEVGRRHGKPVIFEVDSKAMFDDGFDFFLSKNGVWLTDSVPVKYVS